MKTKRGNSFHTLLNINADNHNLGLSIHVKEFPFEKTDVDFIKKVVETVTSLVQAERHKGMAAQLERIEHHREHLADAYSKLFRFYDVYVNGKSRTTLADARDKAQVDMLKMMPESLLRQYVALHVSEDIIADVIWSDKEEVEQLCIKVVNAMKEKDSKEQGTVVSA